MTFLRKCISLSYLNNLKIVDIAYNLRYFFLLFATPFSIYAAQAGDSFQKIDTYLETFPTSGFGILCCLIAGLLGVWRVVVGEHKMAALGATFGIPLLLQFGPGILTGMLASGAII